MPVSGHHSAKISAENTQTRQATKNLLQSQMRRGSKEIADVEMFTGDNTKLMSTFRSNKEFQQFFQEQESARVRSTARLPNGRNPTIPTLREIETAVA